MKAKGMKIKGTKIIVAEGIIKDAGRPIGTLMHSLKHGYHPAVKLEIGPTVQWFEQDEPALLEKVQRAILKIVQGEG